MQSIPFINENKSEFSFPTRPNVNTSGKVIALATNYFQFANLTKNINFFKYSVNFEPELPGDSISFRAKIWNTIKTEIEKVFGFTLFNNSTCYSKMNITEPKSFETIFESQPYILTINQTNLVDEKSVESLGLYKRFFAQLIRKCKFIRIRKNFFQSQNSKSINKMEIWPGFNPTIGIFNIGTLLNISLVHKVFRQETALEAINKLMSNSPNDFSSAVQEMFSNTIVLTRYNNDKTYVVDSVAFDESPQSKFEIKSEEITLIDYYKTRYNKNIRDIRQPLLVTKIDKKNKQKLYLIPEFCYLTGLTEEMRSDFQTMKQISEITKGQAAQKMRECINHISSFLNNELCKQDMKNWGISISDKPLCIKGQVLQAGNILLKNKQINVDNPTDVDRQIQSNMYSQPNINKWVILFCFKDKKNVDTFVNSFQRVQSTYGYNIAKPQMVEIKSTNFNDWKDVFDKGIITPDNQIILIVMPGAKGKGILYTQMKRLLTVTYPIPSQIILSGTIQRGNYKLN